MTPEAQKPNRWITVMAWAVGLVFIAAAFLKAWDIRQFATQIGYYRILAGSMELPAAFSLVALESLIGICLLTGLLRSQALLAGAALLAAFMGATTFRWNELQGVDCGCFGSFDRGGPGAVLWQDSILLVLLGITFMYRDRIFGFGAKKIITAVLTFLCIATATYSEMDSRSKVASVQPGQNASGQLNIVIYLSSTCPHCVANGDRINKIAATPNLPPIQIYLAGESGDQFAAFLRESHLNVSYKGIPFSLLWLMTKTVPVLELRRGDTIVARWDGNMPSPEEVVQAVQTQNLGLSGKGPDPSS